MKPRVFLLQLGEVNKVLQKMKTTKELKIDTFIEAIL